MADEKIVVEKKKKIKNKEMVLGSNTNQQVVDGTGTIAVAKQIKKEKKESKFKKFFYGVGKEFERTTWTSKSKLVSDFFVVLAIVVILAVIFTLIGVLMVTYVG